MFALRQRNQELMHTIEALKNEKESLKFTINTMQSTIDWLMRADEQNLKTITEKYTQIKKLEKKIAQMKGSKKIQEEILALKAKRADAKKKIEEEMAALKAKYAESDVETDKELRERERELEMAEDRNEESC
jgi:chromosome segregation ATPase